MITIFTICRPFRGQFRHIQHNALSSWQAHTPPPEIFLFGVDASVAQAAREHGLPFFSIATSAAGYPLVSSAINQAQRLARYDTLCFANADNIYMPSLFDAVARAQVQFDRFMIVGQRRNLEVAGRLSFGPGWVGRMERRLERKHTPLHESIALDYIIWRGDFLGPIPDFAVGQNLYDWWLACRPLQENVPLIDVTPAVTVIHQNHTKIQSGVQCEENEALFFAANGERTTSGHASFIMDPDGTIRQQRAWRE